MLRVAVLAYEMSRDGFDETIAPLVHISRELWPNDEWTQRMETVRRIVEPLADRYRAAASLLDMATRASAPEPLGVATYVEPNGQLVCRRIFDIRIQRIQLAGDMLRVGYALLDGLGDVVDRGETTMPIETMCTGSVETIADLHEACRYEMMLVAFGDHLGDDNGGAE